MNITCAVIAATLKTMTAAASIAVTAPCPSYVSITKAPAGMTLDFTAAPLVRLDISNLSGLTLKGISSSGSQYAGVNIVTSKNVLISSPRIDRPGTAGIAIQSSDAVQIINPLITHSAQDGIDIIGSSNVKIQGGGCQGNVPAAGAHPDCVQMWSFNGLASHDISVSGMTISGDTEGVDNFGSNIPAAYNVTVANNTISSTFANCIALTGVAHAVVSGNRCSTILPGRNVGPAQVRVFCPTASSQYAPCVDAALSSNLST